MRSRTLGINPPAIYDLLSRYEAGDDVISFGQGFPFFGPPKEVEDGLRGAMQGGGWFKYSSDTGIPELREAISRKLARENGIDASPEANIIVTAGSNQGFLNALASITDTGSEVILLSPYYFNHEMAVRMLGCRPVVVPTDERYQPDIAGIEDAISERTAAIVTVSPNNPTGAVYPRGSLEAIGELCSDRGLFHISDEAYEYFTFDGEGHFSPGSAYPDSTISLFTFSKSFGIAGLRVGFMVFPARVHGEVIKVQDTAMICAPVLSQLGARSALELGREFVGRHMPALEGLRELCFDRLSAMEPLVDTPRTAGAFYFMSRVNVDMDDVKLAGRLIQEHRVLTIPGSAFGLSGGTPHLRISYGNVDLETARKGMERLSRGITELSGGI